MTLKRKYTFVNTTRKLTVTVKAFDGSHAVRLLKDALEIRDESDVIPVEWNLARIDVP